MIRDPRLATRPLLLVLPTLLGCLPLPIPHNELITPPATGQLRSTAGTPAAHVPLALSGSTKDSLCSHASVRTSTDSMGRFRFPGVKERRTIFWFTLMENGGVMPYWFCSGSSDATTQNAIQRGTYLWGYRLGDTLNCLQWAWQGRYRMSCNNRSAKRTWTGGEWNDGSHRGTYRVILLDQQWGNAFAAFVQWIDSSTAGSSVHGMVQLVAGADSVWNDLEFFREWDNWYLVASSVRLTGWGRRRLLWFELGPPGQLQQASRPK